MHDINFFTLLELLNRDYTEDLNELDIAEVYKKVRLHIALERADISKDRDTFNKLINKFPFLIKHIEMTKPIFNWNLI